MSVEDMDQWRKVLRTNEEEDAKEKCRPTNIDEWEILVGELTAGLHNLFVMFTKLADWSKFPEGETSIEWLKKLKEADEAAQSGFDALGDEVFEEEETE